MSVIVTGVLHSAYPQLSAELAESGHTPAVILGLVLTVWTASKVSPK